MYIQKNNRGFSLIELIVVCGIIALLVTVVLASIFEARKNTRDQARIAYLAEIELALELYREVNRDYPTNSGEIASGNAIYNDLSPYLSSVPAGLADGNQYYFGYDSNAECPDPGAIVLFAKRMEQAKNSNYDAVCNCDSACAFSGGKPDNGYVIVID